MRDPIVVKDVPIPSPEADHSVHHHDPGNHPILELVFGLVE